MSGLVCVTGSKGAPGATTLALTLALASPNSSQVVLVDADCDGGDLASVLGLSSAPGLVTLAATTRHRFASQEIEHHVQRVASSVSLLAAPSDAEQTASALIGLGRAFVESLAGSTVVADLGRWRSSSPSSEFARAALATVLVVHPTVAGVAQARSVLAEVSRHCPRVLVATRGERPYGAEEVAAAIGCDEVVVLPIDRAGAALVAAGHGGRWTRRSPLMRTGRDLNERLRAVDVTGVGVEVSR